MLRLLEAFFVMVSAVSAATAVRDTRRSRDEERNDRWRREKESKLDALADAILSVGEAAIMWREEHRVGPKFEATQLRLRRALTDALNPWIELDVIMDLAHDPPSKMTTELVEQALNDVANAVDRVAAEARKTWRERKREFRGRA
jgi:hypothetical protein